MLYTLGRGIQAYKATTAMGASPFSPLDLSPALWLDASDPATIAHVAGAVSQWGDKSGNGYHATQGTGAHQPITGTRTINGLNVLDFDGGNDILNLPSGLYSIPTNANAVFVVAATDSLENAGSAGYRLLRGLVSAVTRYGILINRSATNRIEAINNPSFTLATLSPTLDANAHIFLHTYDNVATVRAYYDGGTPATVAGADVTLDSLDLGFIFNGVFAEVLIFPALTDEEINQVGNYLSAKWGITWTNI